METIGPVLLEVNVKLEDISKEHGWPKIAAYVFRGPRRLLAKQIIKQEARKPATGKAEIKLESFSQMLVVKIGPVLDDVRELEKHQPVTRKVLFNPSGTKVEFILPRLSWWCWIKVPYWVTGTVEKQAEDIKDPICHGEVDIYDVDVGFCFLKLPDIVIERIRNSILDVIIDPPPVDLERIPSELFADEYDWCGTRKPLPKPPDQIDIIKKLDSLPPAWSFAKERFEVLRQARARVDIAMREMSLNEKLSFLNREMFDGVKNSRILYSTTAQFRDILADKFLSFRFCLCWYPWIYWLWWPYCWWYSLEKLGTVKLQPDGSFSAKIMLSICRKDIPDLWFVVRQKINAVERVIYARHPVPCNTYWNHTSGDPVHLVVTDPLALACHEEPETDLDPDKLWVVPLAIGNYSLKRIYGTGAGNLPAAKIGLYESISTGLSGSLAIFHDGPFGGTLGLRLLFSSALETAGVKYYRIKYRDSGAGDWIALDREVVRHYSHYNAVTDSLEFLAYQLGPQSVGLESTLFEIPPDKTPNHATEPEARWYVINAWVDLMNGYLNSTKLSNTFVEFKIELFDSSGNRVDPATFGTGGIAFKLPDNNDIWSTVTTEDAAVVNPNLIKSDPEAPAFQTFIFRLQIDNRRPTAAIGAPIVKPSNNSTDPCGMIPYAATDTSIELPYEARHQRKFALYRFRLYRSTNHLLTETGQVGDYGASGSFIKTVNLKPDMLGICNAAAFSENLYIWNMAFNGWNRVGLDASAVRAFALVEE